MEDRLELLREGTDSDIVFLLWTDISEAFHRIPVNRAEQRYTTAALDGKYYRFPVVIFGSGGAHGLGTICSMARSLLSRNHRPDTAAGTDIRGRPLLHPRQQLLC